PPIGWVVWLIVLDETGRAGHLVMRKVDTEQRSNRDYRQPHDPVGGQRAETDRAARHARGARGLPGLPRQRQLLGDGVHNKFLHLVRLIYERGTSTERIGTSMSAGRTESQPLKANI